MAPAAPPAPLSLKKNQENMAVIIHHQKRKRNKTNTGRWVKGKERNKTPPKKGVINHTQKKCRGRDVRGKREPKRHRPGRKHG